VIYEIVSRQQKSRGAANGFGGPDNYIVVVERPEGSEPVGGHPLSAANAKRFGWKMHHIGEYYSRNRGPRSKYAECIQKAHEMIGTFNNLKPAGGAE
jgi:hypothetical protein